MYRDSEPHTLRKPVAVCNSNRDSHQHGYAVANDFDFPGADSEPNANREPDSEYEPVAVADRVCCGHDERHAVCDPNGHREPTPDPHRDCLG